MQADDKISVVMPAYNCEGFVGKAIESILNQTYQNFEFIIIDDGSTDRTAEIVEHHAQQDGRIRVLHGSHGGVSAALNLGIEHATAPWIAIMHADDIALPERLEQQINHALSNPNVALWGTYAYHINAEERILGVSQTGPTTEEAFYALRNNGHNVTVIHPTAMFRREHALEAGGYDTRFKAAEDLEFFDRLARNGPIIAIPQPLLLYRMHSESNTMHRFFEEKNTTRFVRERLRQRLQGNEAYAFEDFIQEYKQRHPLTRGKKRIDDLSRFYYRKAGITLGKQQYPAGILYLGLSAVLNPRYVFFRLWRQRFSQRARITQGTRAYEARSRNHSNTHVHEGKRA